MCSVEAVRTGLAEWFEDKARFREAKAEQFPDDSRNRRSANALREVACYVKSLPDDHRRLVAFAMCEALFPYGFMAPNAEAPALGPSQSDYAALRCGFDYSIDPAVWFDAWAEQVAEESVAEAEAWKAEYAEADQRRLTTI
jgi:hypothetical protein